MFVMILSKFVSECVRNKQDQSRFTPYCCSLLWKIEVYGTKDDKTDEIVEAYEYKQWWIWMFIAESTSSEKKEKVL